MTEKTHYRKAFNSPYLGAADIVAPTVLTVKNVELLIDKTKKTKDLFNTAFFVEKEIRQGEKLKPMILNATNSRTMAKLTGSSFIDDWANIPVTVYVDKNVRMMGETVDGLRISTEKANIAQPCTDDQINEISVELEEVGADVEAFKKMMGIEYLSDLNSHTFKEAKRKIDMKRKSNADN